MTRPHRISRRGTVAGLAALLASGVSARPARARSGLGAVVDRARGLDPLHALIVARDGVELIAEAIRGPGLDRPANVKSISKTLVAALAGAAIDRGVLSGVDQPVLPLLADRAPTDPDPRLTRLTVDHLLTMRAGLERTSGANYGRWVSSADWVRFALGRPFIDEPGGAMLYSTGSYHLLSAVLTEASGRSLLALARDWLGTPLGVEIPAWTRDPQGIYLGGNEMALTPRAVLRFGEMYRLGGVWNGARVLSRDWVEASWTPRTRSPFSGDDYGYGWFLDTARGHPIRYARGYGGQMLFVVPDLNLTVVITSDPTRPARSADHVGDLRALLAEAVIPAVEGV